MVNDIVITGAEYKTINGAKPFQKLFPVDTIVKPVRPELAGIKYYINGDVDSGDWADPKNVSYPKDYRVYIPGCNTNYKYFITPIGQDTTLSITYPKTIFVKILTIFYFLIYLETDVTSKVIIPLGTLISTISPNSFPNNPLPMGEFTDSFPFFISDSESATSV